MPLASRYNLGGLCQQLSIPNLGAHRALSDAKMTHQLFLELYDLALELPVDLLAEIVRLGEPVDWDGFWFFQEILKTTIKRKPIQAKYVRNQNIFDGLFYKEEILSQPLKPNAEILSLDVDEISSILEPGGEFSKFFKNFEYRPQQVDMLRSVSSAFSNQNHLMVEAGTGTGKSFAYLIPAAFWSIKNNHRVVISTNTIALQDQLINKDIPDLCSALDIPLRTVVLKGRANYLCPRRLEAFRFRGPENKEEMRVLGKILVWLHLGGDGDRTRLNLNSPMEREIWQRLSADDENCNAETCTARMGGICPFYQVRQAAQNAHVLVVNHALLLSDVVTGSRVLPSYEYLIIDEGHHLEAASTNTLSYRITQNEMQRMLRELGSVSSGILGRLISALKQILRPSEFASAFSICQRMTDLAFRLEHDWNGFFDALQAFLESERDFQPIGMYAQQVRILPATRTVPSWSTVEIQYDQANETMSLLIKLVKDFLKDLSDTIDNPAEDIEEAIGSLSFNHQRMTEASTFLYAMILQPEADYIYWIEQQPDSTRMVLQIAPLHIGSLMEKYLWHDKASIILTSATLTAHGEFDYLRNRLNADEADELIVGSPFDYENATMLYLPNDIPEPSQASAYQRMVEHTLVQLSKATGGRLLALFTSYAQLKKTSQAIAPRLADADIQVYEQGEGASANTLLESFRDTDRAVLLGTRAFWEGVDIPGDALSVLVIVKLPFAVPSDPIVAARSETFEDPFNEYSIPEAILTFRQGFGRLIRTQYDRGIVVVLDRRVSSKRYGKYFIESLPPCNVVSGSVSDLPKKAAQWLNI
jgi:DNA polymerase-3 subunit epsilon/ATP-dependent DNA helicase DinG